MDFDLARVRAFVAVAETLHFRHAAEELHITQPALSRQIQALERQLGIQLFERDRRAVALTPAGRQLLADSASLLAVADEINSPRAGVISSSADFAAGSSPPPRSER